MRARFRLRGLLDEDNLAHFQDDTAERGSVYAGRTCVGFVVSTRWEMPVNLARGASL